MNNVVTLDERSKAIFDRHSNIYNMREGYQLREKLLITGVAPAIAIVLILLGLYFTYLLYFVSVISFFLIWRSHKRIKEDSTSYPLYTPAFSSAKIDPLDIDPKTRKPRAPRAHIYLGADPTTLKQAWLNFDVAKQHLWLQATTGGGKTETLSGIYTNFLIYGSAGIFADGKADMSLPAKIVSLAHRFMRANDVYIINYITGNQSPWGKTKSELSSTVNPFLTGSVSSISELIKALLQDDGDIWSKRTASFVDALTRVLVYLRDAGEMKFNISHYGQYLQLEALGKLAGRSDIPMSVRRELYIFVKTLPGLDADGLQKILKGESLDPRKSQQPLDQLGYVTMGLQPTLNMLSGDYGYIFDVIHGNINIRDIVLKRRILLVLIPALEKAAPSLRSLGQIVIALIRDLLASGIGNQTEGDIDLALRRRFTNDIAPYLGIYDEAGYYWVENAFAPIYAQSRSIGLVNIVGSQDNYAMEKAGEKAAKEVKTVLSNSNTKIIGKLEDSGDSIQQVIERIKEVNVYKTSRMEREFGSLTGNSFYSSQVEIEKEKALTPEDFYILREGEAYIIHMDRHVRVDMFAAFPAPLKNQTANVLIPPAEIPEHRFNRLIADFKSVKKRYILGSRGNYHPLLHTPTVSEDDNHHLVKQIISARPTMAGAFLAIKELHDSNKQRLDQVLGNFYANLDKSSIVDLNRQRAEHTANEAANFDAGLDGFGFGDEALYSDTKDETSVNNNAELPSQSEQSEISMLSNQFNTIFGSDSTIAEDLAIINATEAATNNDIESINNAKKQASLTVSKIDQALTDYPTPPPASIDHERLIETLERVKDIINEVE